MKISKRLICVLVCISICASMLVSSFAEANTFLIKDILTAWEDGLNNKDQQLYLSAFDDTMKKGIEVAIQSTGDEKQYVEFFATKQVKVKNIQKLTDTQASGILNLDLYKDVPYEIYYLYYQAELNDKMETKYTKEGENYRICVLTYRNNEWKISELSTAPIINLLEKGIDLGSKKEQEIKPLILKAKETNSSKDIDNLYTAVYGVISEPTSIRVQCRSTFVYQVDNKTNYQYWGIGQGQVKAIPFNTYINDVLPNEWDSDKIVPDSSNESTKLWRALYAGAEMVRTFSWYMVLNPWNPSINADVNDDASQLYVHTTVNKTQQDSRGIYFAWGSMCQAAFNNTYHLAIFYTSTMRPIFAKYVQVDQDDTYALDKQGYTASAIINHIYSVHYGYSGFQVMSY